jgi:hypothetical protein
MTPSKFDEIVKKRAAQRVEQKLQVFERAVMTAAVDLNSGLSTHQGNRWDKVYRPKAHAKMAAIFRRLLGLDSEEGKPSGYPKEIWDQEEALVQTELLATMDEMAKAIAASEVENPSPSVTELP